MTTRTDLTDALVRADIKTAREALFARRRAGDSVAALCDGPISEALHQVGERWKHGPQGILIEHQTTIACIQILVYLRISLMMEPAGPVAIGGTPAGDEFQVASMMAGLVLSSEDWNATNLGPNLPVNVFVEAIRMYRPRLIWISFNANKPAQGFVQAWKPLLTEAERTGATIITGGRAFPAGAEDQSSCVKYLPDMQALAMWAKSHAK